MVNRPPVYQDLSPDTDEADTRLQQYWRPFDMKLDGQKLIDEAMAEILLLIAISSIEDVDTASVQYEAAL